MYRKFYLKYLFLNILISGLFLAAAMYPQNLSFDFGMVFVSFGFGLCIMHMLIIRLPIFNQYYIQRNKIKKFVIVTKKIAPSQDKIAPAMCFLVSGSFFTGILYMFNLTDDLLEYAFLAGISAGNMSYYYAP